MAAPEFVPAAPVRSTARAYVSPPRRDGSWHADPPGRSGRYTPARGWRARRPGPRSGLRAGPGPAARRPGRPRRWGAPRRRARRRCCAGDASGVAVRPGAGRHRRRGRPDPARVPRRSPARRRSSSGGVRRWPRSPAPTTTPSGGSWPTVHPSRCCASLLRRRRAPATTGGRRRWGSERAGSGARSPGGECGADNVDGVVDPARPHLGRATDRGARRRPISGRSVVSWLPGRSPCPDCPRSGRCAR